MLVLRPCSELMDDREQIRSALLNSFNEVIKGTTYSESDDLTARVLLDLVAYVLSVKAPSEPLNERDQIRAFTRNEVLRFEMYLREHLLRRTTGAVLPLTESENIPTQPSADHVRE
jgi:hypothetical protein